MTSSVLLRVARILNATSAEGPGVRTAIWVQGCSIRCKGCINPHLFAERGGELISPDDIVAEACRGGVEGITLLGGEPFDQREASAAVARKAHDAGLGVICFTGFSYDDLVTDSTAQALLQHVDLLVDGPYVESAPETSRALVGSTNQRFINLTSRYADYRPDLTPNRIELRVGPDGSIEAAGFLTTDNLTRLAEGTATRRAPRERVSASKG